MNTDKTCITSGLSFTTARGRGGMHASQPTAGFGGWLQMARIRPVPYQLWRRAGSPRDRGASRAGGHGAYPPRQDAGGR
jgi:hypothetical protein